MTELIRSASDDQVALTICFSAVAFCGMIMYFSHYVGRLSGRTGLNQQRTLPLATSHGTKPAVEIRERAA